MDRPDHGERPDDEDYVDSAGVPTDTNRYARVELAPRDGQTADQLWDVLKSIFDSMRTNGAGIGNNKDTLVGASFTSAAC